jgi:hypothetical protein
LTKEEMVALNDLSASLQIAAEVPNEYVAGEAAYHALANCMTAV